MSLSRKMLVISLLMLPTALATPSVATAEERPHFISNGLEIAAPLNGRGKLNEFRFEVSGLRFAVGCTGLDGEIKIGAAWRSKMKIEFTACRVFSETGEELTLCTVEEPITIDMLEQLVYKNGRAGEEIYDVFFPAASAKFNGGVLVDVDIKGATCAVKGKYEVKGSAIAVPSPNEPGRESKVMTFYFNGTLAPKKKYFNEETGLEEDAGEMTLAGHETFLKGHIEQELESGEKYGAE
jgi:hypothetical protein